MTHHPEDEPMAVEGESGMIYINTKVPDANAETGMTDHVEWPQDTPAHTYTPPYGD